jgi:ankyrin repeat protein
VPPLALQEGNANALHVACVNGDAKEVKQLLEAGVNVNIVNGAGNSPLHLVCFGMHENGCELAKLLLSHGAKINAISSKGFSPLHAAAYSNDSCLCKLLIGNHADVSIMSHSGFLACDVTLDNDLRKLMSPVETRASPICMLAQRRESKSLPSLDFISQSSASSASTSPVSRVRIPRDRSISSPFLNHK